MDVVNTFAADVAQVLRLIEAATFEANPKITGFAYKSEIKPIL